MARAYVIEPSFTNINKVKLFATLFLHINIITPLVFHMRMRNATIQKGLQKSTLLRRRFYFVSLSLIISLCKSDGPAFTYLVPIKG